MKILFNIAFIFNVMWGCIFGMYFLSHTYVINNDDRYNCSISYQEYSQTEPDAPTLLGSKKLAYYTVYSFFNFSDDPSWKNDTDFECLHKNIAGPIMVFILGTTWLSSLFISIISANKKQMIIIPTILSLFGIVWWWQAWLVIGF